MDTNNTLRNLLAKNIVRFTFRKVDGTIRNAVGTRNLALAQAYLHTKAETRNFVIPTPKGEEQPNSYYDIEKMGWRSYKPELLISIDGFVAIDYTADTPTKAVELPNPTPKVELPKVELPKGGEMPKGGFDLGGLDLGGLGIGGLPIFGGGLSGGKMPIAPTPTPTQLGGGKVGTPTFTEDGIALPIGAVSVEDFAKLVAKYVVDLLAYRLTN